jgi:3-carboxy-cis,cis-muconate cycloisomerase
VTPFAPLFVPDELLEAVSARSWLAAMLDAERALANAGAAAGIVPAPAAAAIAEACDPNRFDPERLLREGRAAATPVEPLVRALVVAVGDEHSAWVHRGATSQDVVDTAAMLVAGRSLELILSDLDRVAAACAGLARAHRATPMPARTLLQHALPTTFGVRAAGWLVEAVEARRRLRQVAERGLAAQLGGAAGTLAAFGEHGLEMLRLFAAELGLAEPPLPWHTNRVHMAELGAALDVTAGALGKIALDVVLLAQTDVGEVAEARGGGSSTLPQKRNPAAATRARAAVLLAHAQASVLTAALPQELDRAAGGWQAEWDALSGALAYTGGAADCVAASLEGLTVDAARMRGNLEATGEQIVAERLALHLGERLGRRVAHELVAEAGRRAASSGRGLGEELLGDGGTGLTREELTALLDPDAYLGSAGALVDRALALYEAEESESR